MSKTLHCKFCQTEIRWEKSTENYSGWLAIDEQTGYAHKCEKFPRAHFESRMERLEALLRDREYRISLLEEEVRELRRKVLKKC